MDCVSFLLFYQLTCEYSRLCEERPLYSQYTTFSVHFKRDDDQMRRKIRFKLVPVLFAYDFSRRWKI